MSNFWIFLLDRFRVAILITFFILLSGFLAYKNLPRENEPSVEIPAATVQTIWPGASPSDIEKLITNKIEKKIKNLENLEKITSTSVSGASIIFVEFEVGTDLSENLEKLRTKVDETKSDLPDSIPEDPKITEISISDQPIISLVLSGNFSWSELKKFSEILEDELESVSKVKRVSTKGVPEDKIHIFIDPKKIEAQKIGIDEIFSAIRAAHKNMPLGEIIVGGQKIEATIEGELESATEFLSLPILKKENSIIKLGDVAAVRREFDKFEVETFFGTEKNSQPAILIDVIKSAAKGNILKMNEEILARIEKMREIGILPENLEITVSYDLSDEIRRDLKTLTDNGFSTIILIAIIMFFALGLRESILASIAIPLSFSIALAGLFISDETFNGISLFALVLALGLLVDNAIIIAEGISDGVFEKKISPRDAAIETIKNFRWPIISGTLTTIFAFLPMMFFITGVSGDYISVLPKTVTIVLCGAVFVSIFLLPVLGAKFFEKFPPKKIEHGKFLKKAQNWYQKKMQKILSSKKKIFSVIFLSLSFFSFATFLVINKNVVTEVFPSSDQNFFTAKFELPSGANLDETRKLIEPISAELRKFFEPQKNGEIFLKNFIFTVGRASDLTSNRGGGINFSKENILGLAINLTDKENRKTRSFEILPIIQKKIEKILPKFVETEFSELSSGPPSGAEIEVRVQGKNFSRLEKISAEIKKEIEKIPGTKNVQNSSSGTTKQIKWKFDREKLLSFGLVPAKILESLRAGINGVTVVKFSENNDEIDVDARIDFSGKKWDDPQSLNFLSQIPIKIPNGNFIFLEEVATPILKDEFSEIDHENGLRVLKILGDLERGMVAAEIESELQKIISKINRMPDEIIEIGGENEEGNRIVQEMFVSMAFALILILIVLVWQFNSFSQSIIILLLIPLSLTSVFIGFWLIGKTMTMPTQIGIVSLAGIIVNDAIVLIDRINQHLKMGHEKISALISAGSERLQPIFLTSITTIIGLLPLSLSDEVWGGLGFAIIFGMTLSTVLTLLLTPCFLLCVDFFKNFCVKIFFLQK